MNTAVAKTKIRGAMLSDASDIASLCDQWGYPMSAERCLDCLEYLLGNDRDSIFVAINGSDRLVGWVHAQSRTIISPADAAEIVGIIVDQNARRQGIGRKLIDACEQWARENGFEKLNVKSNAVRPEAHEFYPGIGFELVKTQRSYCKKIGQTRIASNR